MEYIKKYRPYFYGSQSYAISESSSSTGIKWIKDKLIKHPECALPAGIALLKSDMEYEIILMDATEPPIERETDEEAHQYTKAM